MLKGSGFAKVFSVPVTYDVGETCKIEFLVSTEEKIKLASGDVQKYLHVFNAEAWGSAAEFLYNNLKKGDEIYFEYLLRKESWETESTVRHKDVLRLTYFRIMK